MPEAVQQETPRPILPIRVFSQDESRFGLTTVQRRRITRKGIKPIKVFQQKFESFYLYGVMEPATGASYRRRGCSDTLYCNGVSFAHILSL